MATLKSDFFDFVTKKVKENANGIKKAADALIAPLERAIVAAQSVFDSAQGKVQGAAASVREEEHKVSDGRINVNNIRNKMNSVCLIRSCGSGMQRTDISTNLCSLGSKLVAAWLLKRCSMHHDNIYILLLLLPSTCDPTECI